MKRLITTLITALLALPAAAAVSETSVPGADSPTIQPDRSITFKFKAPDARTVRIAGGDGLGAGPFDMTRGPDGSWTVTTPSAVPDMRGGRPLQEGFADSFGVKTAFEGA